MASPAAKQNDRITATDTHVEMVPSPSGAVPTPVPTHQFSGMLDGNLSSDVNIMSLPAATVGSIATNSPPHLPMSGPFANPPRNQGRIVRGSATVFINSKAAARAGDTAMTCNDPVDLPIGTVVAQGTVFIGG